MDDPDLAQPARYCQVLKPETILRWHRSGFKAFWRWKSRNRAGRPKIDRGLRDLIQWMSKENPLWGASRIHGELLMLGFEVAQSTVSKYMVRGGKPRLSACPFRKFHPARIRIVRQNHRMIGVDACNPALAWDVHRRLVQVAAPA
jgi:hypothetical protein